MPCTNRREREGRWESAASGCEMIEIDPIVLGHNQFIGVNHLSQEMGREKEALFRDLDAVTEVVRFSVENGVRALMVSSHPHMKIILEHLRERGVQDLTLYPIIPSAQEYVRQLGEKGALGLLNEMLASSGILTKSRILLKGGLGVLKGDTFDLLGTLIDMEMLPFKHFPLRVIFLHNILTDLALGLGNREVFSFWVRYIREKYNVVPGFATMNFARLARSLDQWGLKDVVIMASFNKAGFQMNPSRGECERCLKEYDVTLLAMSTLASGYLKPAEAYEYLFSLPKVRSVVVGASTKEHARETFGFVGAYQGKSL